MAERFQILEGRRSFAGLRGADQRDSNRPKADIRLRRVQQKLSLYVFWSTFSRRGTAPGLVVYLAWNVIQP